jgi:hypothetical protein
MRAEAFNLLWLSGILAVFLSLFIPSVGGSPTTKPGLVIIELLQPSLGRRQTGGTCGPVTGAEYVLGFYLWFV